ncbi:hypothetical protein J6590_061868 [Homalodisca vitripennis]|nr:hypothetical protein J6590_061868 [Homalodisca vitripennis]
MRLTTHCPGECRRRGKTMYCIYPTAKLTHVTVTHNGRPCRPTLITWTTIARLAHEIILGRQFN